MFLQVMSKKDSYILEPLQKNINITIFHLNHGKGEVLEWGLLYDASNFTDQMTNFNFNVEF